MNDEDKFLTVGCFPDGGDSCDRDIGCFLSRVRENIHDTAIFGNENGIWSRDASVSMRVEFTSIARPYWGAS
jgi:hypothetical protein